MRYISILIIMIVAVACMQTCHSSGKSGADNYQKEIDEWHQKRIDHLTENDSWLSLAGLYWLHEGGNSFGSDSANDLVFPPKAPAKLGKFILSDSTVHVKIDPGIAVTHENQEVHALTLQPDISGNPTILQNGSLSWYVIKRGDKWGVRLKDRKNPVLQNFKGIKRYPVDKKWRLSATFIAFDSTRTMNIPTVLGQPSRVIIPGRLNFKINNKSFEIIPISEEGSPGQWFIVFGDRTNGRQSYGGGRFMYVNKVDDGETTYIDFNTSYNPPCAFTAFATCPLPPPENRLDIAIKAGEQNAGTNSHSVPHTNRNHQLN